MRTPTALQGCLCWLVLLCGTASAADLAYLVVLRSPPAAQRIAEARAAGAPLSEAEIEAYRAGLRSEHEAFLRRLRELGIAHTAVQRDLPEPAGGTTRVPLRWTLIHNAVAIQLASADLARVRALSEVRALHRDRWLYGRLDRSVAYTRAPQLYGGVAELGPFDDLREGFEGQGLHIAVIDSGIDWSHEQFGGDPAPPRYGTQPALSVLPSHPKVVYYLSLMENLVDDFGHGTHVAATAAGYLGFAPGADGLPLTADDVAVHGVAPQARLMGYKACSGVGSATATLGCLGSSVQLALEDALSPTTLTGFPKPVADVVNLSLGGPGDPDDFFSEGADNAVRAGAIVVAAGGNAGPDAYTLDSPGMARRAIQVAAHNDPGVFPNRLDVVGAQLPAQLVYQAPDSNARQAIGTPIDGHYVFAGFADTPDQVPLTVSGRICLVERGSTAEAADNGTGLFANKAANCEAKGAIATVVYNDEPGEIGAGVLAPSSRPLFTAARSTGLLLQGLGYDVTGLSRQRISLSPRDSTLFAPAVAGFSSRGPMPGLGQVKPDLAAPGVEVMAATTAIGVPLLSMADPSRYTAANGTSMATPHVSGAAALLKQAHPEWSADEVRAALMNSASNGRDALGREATDGWAADSIFSQGAGLIDVAAAAAIPALFGVPGDGIIQPSLLASHSFGAVPVLDSRVRHTSTIELSLRDLSAEGGHYALRVAPNRDLDLAGVSVGLGDAALELAPLGTAQTQLDVTVDGDVLRDPLREHADGSRTPIQLQGYVIAERQSDGRRLRLPFALLPTPSEPAALSGSESQVFEGLLPASDAGAQAIPGVSYIDHPIELRRSTFRLAAELSFEALAAGLPDLDLFLLDPDGVVVASSTQEGGPEALSHATPRGGTWTLRVNGWASGPTPYRLQVTQSLGGEAPTLLPFSEDSTAEDGTPLSTDAQIHVRWQGSGGELGYELYRTVDGGQAELVYRSDDGNASEAVLDNQPNGRLSFYLRGLHQGRIGYFVSQPSAPQAVRVDVSDDPGQARNLTPKITATTRNARYADGVFEFDLSLRNDWPQAFVAPIDLSVFQLKSASKSVRVINADNGGSGTSPTDAARFGYADRIGADGVFAAGETSAPRRLQFASTNGESFSFKLKVSGYERGGDSTSPAPAEGDEAAGDDDLRVLLFTVNPLLGRVLIELIDGLP